MRAKLGNIGFTGSMLVVVTITVATANQDDRGIIFSPTTDLWFWFAVVVIGIFSLGTWLKFKSSWMMRLISNRN